MKRIIPLVFLSFLVLNPLSAEFEDNLGEEELTPPAAKNTKPFAFEGEFDRIGSSHFTKGPFKHNNISFTQGTASFQSVVTYNPCCKEGAFGEVGYSYTNIDWENNPFFNQTSFNTVYVAATLFTERLHNWLWTFRFAAGIDVDDHAPPDSTTYDILLWGRYNINRCWGAHFGFLGQTGMRIDHVYPILGFDWKPNAKWELSIVYPVDISLIYNLNCNWSIALAARFWDSRFRINNDQPIPQGLLVYENAGVELETRYHYNDWLSAQVHAGYTTGGQLKVANKQYRHKRHFDFDAAPYVGGDFTLSF